MLAFRGRVAEALAQFLAARQEDPASAVVSSWVSYTYYIAGQIDSALVESDRAFSRVIDEHDDGWARRAGATQGWADRASSRVRSRLPTTHSIALYILAATGDGAVALGRLRKIESGRPKQWLALTTRGFVMLGIGDTTASMTAFEQATQREREWPSMEAIRDPMFDPMRQSARFQRLIQRVGLAAGASSR